MMTGVQTKSAKSPNAGDTAPTLTLTSLATAGNLLTCLFQWDQADGARTLTPPAGWNEAGTEIDGGTPAPRQRMFYKISDGTEQTVAGTLSGIARWVLSVQEWNSTNGWPAGTGALDKVAQSSSAGSTTPDSGTTASTAQADELWYAGLNNKNIDTQSAQTNGFTEVEEKTTANSTNANNVNGATHYKIVTAAGTANVSATIGNSRSWVGQIATFMDNAPAAPTSPFVSSLTSVGSGR